MAKEMFYGSYNLSQVEKYGQILKGWCFVDSQWPFRHIQLIGACQVFHYLVIFCTNDMQPCSQSWWFIIKTSGIVGIWSSALPGYEPLTSYRLSSVY